MATPSFGIAIPVYNRTRYLGRAIDSVLSQATDSGTVSLLVVDDASTEDVEAVVASFRRSSRLPISFVRNPVNLGLVGNWNRCLELAEGDVINILHSDEVLAFDALRRVRDAWSRFPGLGMACSGHGTPNTCLRAGAAAAEQVAGGVYPVSSVFLSRSAIEKCGLYDPAFPFSPDDEFYPRIAASLDVLIASPPLALSFRHSDHYMLRTWERADFLESYRAVRTKAWSYAGRTGEERERRVHMDLTAACRHITNTCWMLGRGELGRRYYEFGARELGLAYPVSERFLRASSQVRGALPVARRLLAGWRRLRTALPTRRRDGPTPTR